MKRYLAILCAIALMLSLAACGTTGTEDTTNSATEGGTVQTSPAPAQTGTPADASTKAPTEAPLGELFRRITGDYRSCFWFFSITLVFVIVGFQFILQFAGKQKNAILASENV